VRDKDNRRAFHPQPPHRLNRSATSFKVSDEVGSSIIRMRALIENRAQFRPSAVGRMVKLRAFCRRSSCTPSGSQQAGRLSLYKSRQLIRPPAVVAADKNIFRRHPGPGTGSTPEDGGDPCLARSHERQQNAPAHRSAESRRRPAVDPGHHLNQGGLAAPFSPSSAWTSPGAAQTIPECSTSTPAKRLVMSFSSRIYSLI